MELKIYIVNAFIDGSEGGNPAGVVLDADYLNDSEKLLIAKQVGLSETAFVSASSSADFKLDFFTPTRQIAHCGHATIAVFSYLAQTGKIGNGWLSKETIDGNRKILIQDELAFMEQLAPKYQAVDQHYDTLLDSLGVKEQQLVSTPKIVDTGNSFIILGVENTNILSQLKPDFKKIHAVSDDLDLIGYYVFSPLANNADRDATTRMFAPRYGIDEEAATGMAAGPLACYLYDEINIKNDQFKIEQGKFMRSPSPSLINVNLDIQDAKINSLMAGGTAKLAQEFVI